jgi:UDP-N-acetyl-D-glucosamine dehydrogenase
MQITVVGQGYVGLPLAIAAAESGIVVFGLDSDKGRIKDLCKGVSPFSDISSNVIGKNLDSKYYKPTTDVSVIAESEIILICVPTPITVERTPDLSFLIKAISSVAKNLRKGSLIIIESTIEPGTCQNLLLPMLLKESGLGADDFDLAYSPERIDPANLSWTIKNTPKLLAGLTSNAVERSRKFYNQFVDSIIICSSIEIAETAKLLENSFRLINISFINEISHFCQKLGIDVTEVIKAAATKPYGFMPFYPSVGVGGHCIPVDPLYLSNKARELGASTRFIDLADQINQEMPGYFVGRVEEKLSGLKNKKILVVGVAYKPNVADVRETPAAALISGLRNKGAQVSWHDDLVKEWNGEKSVDLKPGFDLAIIATPHTYLDLKKLGDTLVLDTRGSI